MINIRTIIAVLVFICHLQLLAQDGLPKPTQAQLQWHNMEFYLFMHFGPNTFTGKEWGEGNEREEVFNPTSLDCGQWCRIAKAAGLEK